ncbi:MAG: hypothetical protein RLY14_907 [Planctomycetota bacterium]
MLWSDASHALAPGLVAVGSNRRSGITQRGSPLSDNSAFFPVRGADEVIPSPDEGVALLKKKRIVQLELIDDGVIQIGIRISRIERWLCEVRVAGGWIKVMPGVFCIHRSSVLRLSK